MKNELESGLLNITHILSFLESAVFLILNLQEGQKQLVFYQALMKFAPVFQTTEP